MVHLETPGPDTGVFSTDEVRPRNKPAKSTSRIIALPRLRGDPYYKQAPNLAAGFRSLDLSHEKTIRANLVADGITRSQFKISLESWGNSTMYGASATWLEHKANARDCQFGQFDTQETSGAAKGSAAPLRPIIKTSPQEYSRAFKFSRAFKVEPEVVCWLNRIDMASGDDSNYRIRAYATKVSPTGFTAHIDSWADSQLNGAAMCWIAFPKGKASVECGSFSTSDVRSWSNPKPKNSGTAKFKNARFNKAPTVLVALNMLDMAGNADLRISTEVAEISTEGFRWHLDTWGDSTLYAGSASWIALGFV